MCIKNVLQVFYWPNKKTCFLTYREKKREREKKKRYHLTDVSNTNGDFLHTFLHKAPQECADKNMEVLGKRKFFKGKCQWSLLNSHYLYDDWYLENPRSYMLTSGIKSHCGLYLTAVFSLINIWIAQRCGNNGLTSSQISFIHYSAIIYWATTKHQAVWGARDL